MSGRHGRTPFRSTELPENSASSTASLPSPLQTNTTPQFPTTFPSKSSPLVNFPWQTHNTSPRMPPRLPSGTAALESALAQTHISSSTRAFTTTAPLSGTAQRRWRMHQWLRGRGGAIWNDRGQREDPGPRLAGPSADQPFPLNPQFKSEPVLSPLLRGKIFGRIKSKKTEDRKAYLSVSREFGVDVRRVAAVVRLRAVEKEMLRNVSCSFFYSPPITVMMILCITISLEDIPMVTPIEVLLIQHLSQYFLNARRERLWLTPPRASLWLAHTPRS